MTRITAVQTGTNADLIATAQALYPMTGHVIDLTPGAKLGFWKTFRPDHLTLLDTAEDYRNTSHTTAIYDHVVFDPDYVATGGRDTSTIHDMNERYGMLTTEKNPQLQWENKILPGLTEANRLLARRGLLWFKSMDYVTSGRVHWFTKLALDELETRGFRLVDEFILSGHPGPQPTTDRCRPCAGRGFVDDEQCKRCAGKGSVDRRQVHARRAHSVLMIARKIRHI